MIILYVVLGLALLWLCAALWFVKESLWNGLTDLPQRFIDSFQARRERRERRRIERARQRRYKDVIEQIRRREF